MFFISLLWFLIPSFSTSLESCHTTSRCMSHNIPLHVTQQCHTTSRCMSHNIPLHVTQHPAASHTTSCCMLHNIPLHVTQHPAACHTTSRCMSHNIPLHVLKLLQAALTQCFISAAIYLPRLVQYIKRVLPVPAHLYLHLVDQPPVSFRT